jgi:hypothetical protein
MGSAASIAPDRAGPNDAPALPDPSFAPSLRQVLSPPSFSRRTVRALPRLLPLALALAAMILTSLAAVLPAGAVEAVRVTPQSTAIDLTPMIERYRSDGDLVQISTAAGRDGIVRRIAVKARETGSQPDWIAFALTNSSDEQLERVLVAPHFRLVGSGLIWPDLGASRIAAITASEGIRPERVPAPTPTCSRSRSIPARPSRSSPNWRPETSGRSISGKPRPTRPRSTG